MSFTTTNPATGERIRTFPLMSDDEVARKLDAAHDLFPAWRALSFPHRADCLRRAAAELRAGADEFAHLMAVEMGKPLAQGRAEVEKSAWVCEYYAEGAADILADEPIDAGAGRSFVTFQPLGVIFAIMPWNFPFWQVFRFAAPTLMAGNVAVLKHAPNVPECARAIERIFRRAGVPAEAFQNLFIDHEQAGLLIDDWRVRAVTLTGSTRAGKAVAARAGAHIKKTVLELGGSDPYVILDDADVEAAARSVVTSRLINTGQSCIAAKRLIVTEPVRDAFESAVVRLMAEARMGDPLEEGVDLGPLARLDLRETLARQVEVSVAMGARCLLGGEIPPGPGAYYPATVLTDVRAPMPAYEEELFGPVAAILPVADEAEALHVANDTSYGLGAAVYTADRRKGERIARSVLDAGACFVNDFVRSDPRLPFGGTKQSGYGRELAPFGIREFVNIKTVWVG